MAAQPDEANAVETEADAETAIDPAAGLDVMAPAPAPEELDNTEDDYDAYPQRVSYESDTDFSAELPVTTPHADIASAFSSIGASASHFFKGHSKRARNSLTTLRKSAPLPRGSRARGCSPATGGRGRARARGTGIEQNDAEQPVSVDVADATTSFEAPQPSPADVAGETATFETQQPVDSTVSFDATMTFEKQGTAIAEPLSAPVEDEPAAPDTVEDQSVAEQVAADSSEQEPEPVAPEAPQADESRPYSTQIFTMPAPSDPGATVANAAPSQAETVDALMAQISSQASPRPNMNVPDPASAPAPMPSASPLASVPDPRCLRCSRPMSPRAPRCSTFPTLRLRLTIPSRRHRGPSPHRLRLFPPCRSARMFSRLRLSRLLPLRPQAAKARLGRSVRSQKEKRAGQHERLAWCRG